MDDDLISVIDVASQRSKPFVNTEQPSFVVCIDNSEYPVSLECRKIYPVLPDEQAGQHSMLRLVDESGEDYLYPTSYFLAVELRHQVQRALELAA